MTPTRLTVLLTALLLSAVVSVSGVDARENESFGLTAYPEEAGGVERNTFSIPLETGETFEDAVRIYNRTDQTLDLAVYAADAKAGPGDTDVTNISVGFRTENPKGVGSWIDLARDTVRLDPREEVIVTFRVKVNSAEPSPAYGAIVVENTSTGSSGSEAQREFLTVLTAAPNSETQSVRVRPLLLRSPWIVVAILGLLLAAALVWIGARRAKRPKDVLVPAGEIDQPLLDLDDVPEASRPVIKRLGTSEPDEALRTKALDKPKRASKNGARTPDAPVEELGDTFLVEIDPPASDDTDTDLDDEDDLPPARPRPARKPAARRSTTKQATKKKAPVRKTTATKAKPKGPAKKAGYIPLDDI